MKLSSLYYVLGLLSACVLGYRFRTDNVLELNTQILLQRLQSAHGNHRTLDVVKTLLAIKSGESKKIAQSPVADVIEAIEEIVVLISRDRSKEFKEFLYQSKLHSNQLSRLNVRLQFKLDALSWHSRLMFGVSSSRICKSYVYHELQLMRKLKKKIYSHAIQLDEVMKEVQSCVLRCKCALKATLTTLSTMEKKDNKVIRRTITTWFNTGHGQDRQVIGESLAFTAGAQEQSTSPLDGNINYLRENIAVIIKSGMFMVFCISFKIYICSFTFGVLLTMSSLIWIAVFLQLIDDTI